MWVVFQSSRAFACYDLQRAERKTGVVCGSIRTQLATIRVQQLGGYPNNSLVKNLRHYPGARTNEAVDVLGKHSAVPPTETAPTLSHNQNEAQLFFTS